jgi:general secretion pathway protein G
MVSMLRKFAIRPLAARANQRGAQSRMAAGFTLIELIVVMAIIAILLALAAPRYEAAMKGAREATLREDLQVMRQAIDSYTMDKQKAPQSLDDLVSAGYLREVPADPITRTKDSWVTVSDDTLASPDQSSPGVTDVHSSSQELSSEGSAYNTW